MSKHYKNGVFSGRSVLPVLPLGAGKSLKIGSRDDLFTKMKGGLDDVRVYNRAFTADEARDLYLSGVKIKGAVVRGVKLNQC